MMRKKILLALLLTAYTGGLLFFFYPSHSELGKSFVLVSVYMMLRYAILIAGSFLLVITFLFFRSFSSNLLYIYVCMLNLAVCLSAIVLFTMHQVTREWLHHCLLNGLLGMGMLLVGWWKGNNLIQP